MPPPKSRPMAGSAVITTNASSATMKNPTEVRASAQPGCAGRPDPAGGWRVGIGSMAAMSAPPGSGGGPGGHGVRSARGVLLRGAGGEHEPRHRSDPPVRPAPSGTTAGHDVLGTAIGAVDGADTGRPTDWAAADRPVRRPGGVSTGDRIGRKRRKRRWEGGAGTTDLGARARAGDAEAFGQLIDPYRRELQVHCYRILGSVQDAEDALQETLLAAWQGLGGFQGRASIRTWLYRIATSRCLNARRSASRRPRMAC